MFEKGRTAELVGRIKYYFSLEIFYVLCQVYRLIDNSLALLHWTLNMYTCLNVSIVTGIYNRITSVYNRASV